MVCVRFAHEAADERSPPTVVVAVDGGGGVVVVGSQRALTTTSRGGLDGRRRVRKVDSAVSVLFEIGAMYSIRCVYRIYRMWGHSIGFDIVCAVCALM